MRIALIILSILSLIFIGSISYSLMSQEKWSLSMPSLGGSAKQDVDNITLETWKNQVKTDEKLERLTTMVEEMAKKNGIDTDGSISDLAVIPTVKPEVLAIKPGGKLLALLMPTVTPELDKNSGIYGLYIFDTNVPYSTYRDSTIPLTFIVMNTPYETFLKNMKALGGNPYAVNEIKTFPFRAFFANNETPDAMVRLAIEMETQTIAFELPKARYDLLKNLLLGKGGTNIRSLQSTTQTGTTTPAKPVIAPKPVEAIVSVAPKTPTTPTTTPSSGSTSRTGSTKTGTTIRIIQ